MMKKTLIIFAVLSLGFMTACSNEATDELSDSGDSTSQSSSISVEKQLAPLSLEIKESEAIDIYNRISDIPFNLEKSYEEKNGITTKVYQNELNTIKSLFYYKDNTDLPIGILFTSKNDNNNAKETIRKIQQELENLILDKNYEYIGKADIETEDNRYIAGFKLLDSGETFSSYKDLSPLDFLSDENRRSETKQMINNLEFQELKKYIGMYIAEASPKQNDFSYDIYSILDNPIIDNLYLEKDSIEKKHKVYYKRKTEISNDINLSPFLDESGMLTLEVGFIQDDWLFADAAILNINNSDNVTLKDSNPEEKVLNNGKIKEVLTYKVSPVEIPLLKDAKEITIRFKGKDSDSDITLTNAEIESLVSLANISGIKNQLSNLIHSYENL